MSTVTANAATEAANSGSRMCELPLISTANSVLVERHAHGAAEDRRHADERPESRPGERQIVPLDRSQRAAHDQERREHAARSTRRQRYDPDAGLDQEEFDGRMKVEAALQQGANILIADAERRRIEKAADADAQAADRRPPHPMDRQFAKQILGAIETDRHQRGLQAGNDADGNAYAKPPCWHRRHVRKGKQRAGPDQLRPPQGGDDDGGGDRNEAARLPLEQQQFDRKQHGGERRAEHRGHAGGRAGDQQRLALGRTQVEELREQGAERAAGHDDRTFGAERAAGADGDGGRQRLEQSDLGLDPALTDQDGLDGFGNAVAADFFRAEIGHQADDHAADDRHDDRPAAAASCRRNARAGRRDGENRRDW